MNAPYVLHDRPDLDEPVLVVMLQGWIDAGAAAASAMALLDAELEARPVATFDGDTFIDYRARRPVMQLRDGVNTNLVWPEIVLKAGRDSDGHDVLVLMGSEPDAQWKLFCDSVGSLAVDLGVRLAVGLGAYPFATPHTRPSRLSITAGTAEMADALPYLRNSVDVPAGVGAALEHTFTGLGVPVVGLWAQVPHYVSNMPYPGASLALLEGLTEVAGVVTEATALKTDAAVVRQRLDDLIAANEEHLAMLRQIEAIYDEATVTAEQPPLQASDLMSGDDLAVELERFLREQGK
jgi:hypothetical protein